MLDIELDHIIHYIHGLNRFEFPGKYLEIQNGGQHESLGTFNRLVQIDLSYIELLDIYNQGKMKQQSKTQNGKYSFAKTIVESDYKQGFKKLCFRTHDIVKLKKAFEARGLETVGPITMTRENKKGHTVQWQLLYVNNHHFDMMMPFFIQWQKTDEEREAELEENFQTNFKIDMVTFQSHHRQTMVENWKQWFDMDTVETADRYTILHSPAKKVKFKIVEGKDDAIDTVQFVNQTIDSPVLIRTRGANYQFVPPQE
ncbi:VOC family protein [Mammaliicoccus fleurettii]|uniref:VOC family protein n=1 Tax=Staphylococcus schleiferi TaxID=1295 RepID=A0ABX0G1F6_STASC|nr:VOC family protein [Staphylococcus schleiferi]NHA34969.1 VOC family protein [Staphylococcus schleiferi]QGS46047.1 VOC family protein [Mammaliicoccus fleurettii]